MSFKTGIAALSFSLVMGVTPPVQAKVFSLVVGIDAYTHITPLQGAVNDAVDIAAAVSGLNPDKLVVLINEDASRDKILSTWRGFLEEADAGDTIIFTFAGHGASEDAAYPETEEDGKDETFLLAGFSPAGAGAAERIRDDEIAQLIELRPEVHHIVVADSCHSGTATRSSAHDLGYRFYTHDGIEDDPLPPPPPPPAGARDTPGGDDDVYFGAVADDELAPEIRVGQDIRGALSYSFADGLRGAADRNRDGTITKGELEIHIRRSVKSLVDGRQKPRVWPVGQQDRALMIYKTPPPSNAVSFVRNFDALPQVDVRIVGANRAPFSLDNLEGANLETSLGGADLVVDFNLGEIRSGNGDMLRRLTREVGANWRKQVQSVVNKQRFVDALKALALKGSLDVYFPYGDKLYFDNEAIDIVVTGRTTRHITVLNLPPDGSIQWLYPRHAPIDRSGQFNDPVEISPDDTLSFSAFVSPDFGAEHIVVIETDTPHHEIRRAANRFDQQIKLPQMWHELQLALKDRPYAIGLHAFFTDDES